MAQRAFIEQFIEFSEKSLQWPQWRTDAATASPRSTRVTANPAWLHAIAAPRAAISPRPKGCELELAQELAALSCLRLLYDLPRTYASSPLTVVSFGARSDAGRSSRCSALKAYPALPTFLNVFCIRTPSRRIASSSGCASEREAGDEGGESQAREFSSGPVQHEGEGRHKDQGVGGETESEGWREPRLRRRGYRRRGLRRSRKQKWRREQDAFHSSKTSDGGPQQLLRCIANAGSTLRKHLCLRWTSPRPKTVAS